MNGLDNLWTLLRYGALAILIIIVGIIIYVLIMVIVGLFKARKKVLGPGLVKKDDYMADATVAGLRAYADSPFRNELSEAFRDGARWGYDQFS